MTQQILKIVDLLDPADQAVARASILKWHRGETLSLADRLTIHYVLAFNLLDILTPPLIVEHRARYASQPAE